MVYVSACNIFEYNFELEQIISPDERILSPSALWPGMEGSCFLELLGIL